MAVLGEALLAATIASWSALLFHETGHAIAAWLVRVRIWGIRLGSGPVVWRGRIARCRIQIALFPAVGAVQLLDADASAIGYRDIYTSQWRFEWGPDAWRAPVISVAGGLGNLCGLTGFVMLWDVLGQPGVGTLAGSMLLLGAGANLAGYLNLLPWFRSDGTHLLAHMQAARTQHGPAPKS